MSALPPPPATSPAFPPSDLPPPPSGDPSAPAAPRAAGGERPGWVTAAGSILIVLGALGVLVGIVLALSRDAMGMQELVPRDAVVAVGIFTVVLSGLELLAGVLVLRRSNAGRVLGIALAGLGVFGGIAGLASEGSAAVGLVLNGLVLYGLLAYGRAFRRGGGG
jgi:hypothetical protein